METNDAEETVAVIYHRSHASIMYVSREYDRWTSIEALQLHSDPSVPHRTSDGA